MAAWKAWLPRRVLVRGPSMAPTLSDGDVVLAWMSTASATAAPGAVVLVRWDQRPHQLSVKRAIHPMGARWYVLGDNQDGSTDSRTLGPAIVVARVALRLWPRPGRLPRTSLPRH